MADPMQHERKFLTDAWIEAGWPPEAAAVLASGNDTQLTVQLSAIAAALRAAPEGFAMVPVEPTEEMVAAGAYAQDPEVGGTPGGGANANRLKRRAKRIYAAMLITQFKSK